MKVFAVLLLAVCAVSAAAVDSVVKVDRAGGNFAYTIDQAGLVPHPYVAHTPYVGQVPFHPGVSSVVGNPGVAYTPRHPIGSVPVPVGGYYGYPYGGAPVAYPYATVVAKPEKIE